MKNLSHADRLREEYMDLCEQLLSHAKDMRNYAMKPGNAWLARGELAKIISLSGDMESLLDDIKSADETE
jgi:hypothetical protein